jgi:hypothetical protein
MLNQMQQRNRQFVVRCESKSHEAWSLERDFWPLKHILSFLPSRHAVWCYQKLWKLRIEITLSHNDTRLFATEEIQASIMIKAQGRILVLVASSRPFNNREVQEHLRLWLWLELQDEVKAVRGHFKCIWIDENIRISCPSPYLSTNFLWLKSDAQISRKSWSRMARRWGGPRRGIRPHVFRLMYRSDLKFQIILDRMKVVCQFGNSF